MSLRVSLNSRVWNFMFFKFMYSLAISYLCIMYSDILPCYALLSVHQTLLPSKSLCFHVFMCVLVCVRACGSVSASGGVISRPELQPALMDPSFWLFVGIHSFSGCHCSLWLKRNIFSQHRQILPSWWKWRKCREALVNPTIWELVVQLWLNVSFDYNFLD